MRIRAAMVDASFLVSDILRSTRSRKQGPFLDALNSGVLRAFVAHQVWAEVPRSVRRAAVEQHLDAAVAEQIWWREYIPWIRVVEVEGLPAIQGNAVLSRDASDVPTMQLASLLVPVVVLASDHDLQDPGIATQKYYQVVEAAEEFDRGCRGHLGRHGGDERGGSCSAKCSAKYCCTCTPS